MLGVGGGIPADEMVRHSRLAIGDQILKKAVRSIEPYSNC